MRLKTGILFATLLTTLALCPFSSALADEPTPQPDASNFILSLSSKSAIPTGDLVAVMCASNSIYTGVNWVDENGNVALKNQLGPNLLSFKKNVLFGTAWEDLDADTQHAWGSESQYQAGNFCSQLDAYGLGDARDRYYASGGSNFSWTSEEESILDKIKGVYDDWSSGKDVLIGNVLDLFSNDAKDDFANYLGASSDSFIIDGSKYNDWPSGAPTTLNVGFGPEFDIVMQTYTNRFATSESLYWIICHPTSNRYYAYPFSKNSFTFYRINTAGEISNSYSVTSGKKDGQDYYYGGTSYSVSGTVLSVNMPLNGDISSANVQKIIPLLLFGNDLNASGTITPDIEGYPEDIQAHANVKSYFPSGGVTENSDWQKYLEYIEEDTDDIVTLLKRILTSVRMLDSTSEDISGLEEALNKFHFYSNGILKVHDEGIFDSITDIGNDIHDILETLTLWPKGDAVDAPELIGDFNFPQLQTKAGQLVENISDLAPFGGLLLLSEMVGILSQTGNISKPDFHVPFKFMPGHEYEVVIDLSWLDDGRVYINFFCILSLVVCLLNVTIRIIELEAAS